MTITEAKEKIRGTNFVVIDPSEENSDPENPNFSPILT